MLCSRLSKRSLVVVLAGLALAGCPDPEGSFDDFVERTIDARVPAVQPDAGATIAADITGTFFVAVATHLGPTSPLFFKGDAVVDTSGEVATVTLTLTSLNNMERSVNSDNVIVPDGPSDYGEDGKFIVKYTAQDVQGNANPITGNDLVVTLGFDAKVLGEDVFCGDIIEAEIIEPPAGAVMEIGRAHV